MAAKPRLDMDHGFMWHIIKNQVDRDNYDKEVKGKGGKSLPKSQPTTPSQTATTNRTKKPDLPTYVARKKIGEAARPLLFKLEYEDKYGELHDLPVHQNDDPSVLSRKFAQEHSLSVSMTKAFCDFIREEMTRRQYDTNGGSSS